PCRALVLVHETGESLTAAIAQHGVAALAAIGRALAALHTTCVRVDAMPSPVELLRDTRLRLAHPGTMFPEAAEALRAILGWPEHQALPGPVAPALVHGDLGPAQLLWQAGRIVVLDFDKCGRGDPALDLGNLLTQLRRLTLRKPGKLPDFSSLRQGILEAYQRRTPPDQGLTQRVAWYEQLTLLRKIHFLAFASDRRDGAAGMGSRRAEAIQLLRLLAGAASHPAAVGDGHAT